MKPSDRNFEVSLPGSTSYETSWGGAGGSFGQTGVRYAKEDRGGIRRPKPKGWKDPLPYSLIRRVFIRGSGTLLRTWQSRLDPKVRYWDRYSGDVGASQGSPADCVNAAHSVMPEGGGVDLSRMEEDCYAACYKKARQQTVNVGVALAEAGKTANLITSTATRCARSLLLLRRGRVAQAASVLGVRPGRRGLHWSQKWLEWKYGWMPLLSDIHSSAEHLSRFDPWSWKMTASKRIRQPCDRSAILGSGFSKCVVDATGWTGVHVRMDFIPSDMLELSALGVTNPALVAWELLPYSFVIDWMVPVGDWLVGLDHACAIANGVYSSTRFTKQNWTVAGLNDSGVSGIYDLTYNNSWSGSVEFVSLRRIVGPLTPPPYPRLRNPITGLTRMVTALALLRNAFK